MEPFKEEIELVITARDLCEETLTDHGREFLLQRSTSERTKAILITVFDAGMRAGALRATFSEVCNASPRGCAGFWQQIQV